MRYAHTNIAARDWKALADFYTRVFGCRVKPPKRELAGAWLDAATGLQGARLEGVHLLLPGHDLAITAETITVKPNPYIDSETYITGTGVNQARNISTSGVERIYYLGAPDVSGAPNDILVVDPGQGTHTVRVDGGRFTGTPNQQPPLMPAPFDRVTSDSLPQVFGSHLDIFRRSMNEVTRADVNAALQFAAEAVRGFDYVPLSSRG